MTRPSSILIGTALGVAILSAAVGAIAKESAVKPVDRATFARLAPLFQERLGATPETITTSEVPGLYEAFVGDKAFYVTPDGKYVLDGILVDFPTKSNITEARASKKRWVEGRPAFVFFSPKLS